MNKQQLEPFAREAAKSIKTESDLNDFRQILSKVTIETALNTDLRQRHSSIYSLAVYGSPMPKNIRIKYSHQVSFPESM